jgi:hypothetical protein
MREISHGPLLVNHAVFEIDEMVSVRFDRINHVRRQ